MKKKFRSKRKIFCLQIRREKKFRRQKPMTFCMDDIYMYIYGSDIEVKTIRHTKKKQRQQHTQYANCYHTIKMDFDGSIFFSLRLFWSPEPWRAHARAISCHFGALNMARDLLWWKWNRNKIHSNMAFSKRNAIKFIANVGTKHVWSESCACKFEHVILLPRIWQRQKTRLA